MNYKKIQTQILTDYLKRTQVLWRYYETEDGTYMVNPYGTYAVLVPKFAMLLDTTKLIKFGELGMYLDASSDYQPVYEKCRKVYSKGMVVELTNADESLVVYVDTKTFDLFEGCTFMAKNTVSAVQASDGINIAGILMPVRCNK